MWSCKKGYILNKNLCFYFLKQSKRYLSIRKMKDFTYKEFSKFLALSNLLPEGKKSIFTKDFV